ncbi:MAG: transcription antitermination factor NusB [Candidatus Absconditabacterales bacterium]
MVNVTGRINARKILLSYLYQHCFFYTLVKKDAIIDEILFVDYVFKTDNEKFDEAKKEFIKKIQEHLYIPTQEEIKDFADMFFDNRPDSDIDFDYLFKVALAFPKYKDELIAQVNTYATTFTFDQMDTIDQAIFILGYTEWKTIQTPKEILLNEMIELAKRYSDEGAPKLINGIMHKIILAGSS